MVLFLVAVTAVPYQVLIFLLFAEELLAGYHQAESQEWPVTFDIAAMPELYLVKVVPLAELRELQNR